MNLNKEILVYGNELIPEDKLAIIIGQSLSQDTEINNNFKIQLYASPDDVIKSSYEEIIVLDVAKGINDVMIIKNLENLKHDKIYSSHDLNLGIYLKIFQNMKAIHNKKFWIIAIPYDWYDKIDLAQNKVKSILKELI